MGELMQLFNQLLPHQRPFQPVTVHDGAEMDSELRRVGEFVLYITFATLGSLIQARENGGTSHPVLLDLSFLAILVSLASSALHLELHRQLRLPQARLVLHLAAFFTTAAVVLLITNSIVLINVRYILSLLLIKLKIHTHDSYH